MPKRPSLMYSPLHVKPSKKAASLFKWKSHDSEIKASDGHIVFAMRKIEAPEAWSPTAIDIAASKYFRKTVKSEKSIKNLIERIGSGLFTAANNSGLFKSRKETEAFCEEVKYLIYSQQGAFNSPVWFNLGLSETYGVKSPSHHFFWDKKKKQPVQINDAYKHPQSSACFIQSIEDSLESIFDLVKSESKLFKYGSGSGSNFSRLRGKNEMLSSGGYSSGLISFLEVLDKAAGAVKSGGTTRRAAKMVCVDLDHPEIEDFINWKWHEEKKAQVLIAAGYSSDLDGETYKSISGQNANNSVRVPDKFMKLVEAGGDWSLVNRSDKKVFKKIKAEQLWRQICVAAWNCADPGLQFNDTINRYHTCANTSVIRGSNPCSEYMFIDDSACNLASLNLLKFLKADGEFDFSEFIHAARTFFIAQECLVDHSSYPTETIAKNSHDYRPLGLGFANLGSMLLNLGLSYDSSEARAWAGLITAIMSGVAYKTSAEMAAQLGPFSEYKKNKSSMMRVIRSHQKSVNKIDWDLLPPGSKELAKNLWDEVIDLGTKFGFRNAQATVIAPTGTIGLVMDCDTTGIEPEFSLVKNKKLSGGGYLRMVNGSVAKALSVLKYESESIKKIEKFLLENGTLKGSLLKKEHESIFACANGDFVLSPDAHLLMMGAVQPFISGAISKTVNLPSEASIEDVSRCYKLAWKLGLKAVAIYRDGSKFVQPLNSKISSEKSAFKLGPAPKCSECGYETILESGCYRCVNCGTTTACAS